MNDKLVIGIIGCGKQSVKHIPALKKLDARIILADANVGLAKFRSEEFGVEHVDSVDDIFGDPEIAAVDICTPTPTHYAFIENAVRSGKHFFL